MQLCSTFCISNNLNGINEVCFYIKVFSASLVYVHTKPAGTAVFTGCEGFLLVTVVNKRADVFWVDGLAQ